MVQHECAVAVRSLTASPNAQCSVMPNVNMTTVSYMPPKQAMGSEVTPRSDLYSLGAMPYEMVTGRPPFLGDDSVAIIGQHIDTPPVAPTWHNGQCPRAWMPSSCACWPKTRRNGQVRPPTRYPPWKPSTSPPAYSKLRRGLTRHTPWTAWPAVCLLDGNKRWES